MRPGSGSVLMGEKGSLVIPHVAMPQLLPEEKFADFKIPVVPARDHYVSWADACRGEDETTSHFDYAGPLTETVLLGTIAIRLPGRTLPGTPTSWRSPARRTPRRCSPSRTATAGSLPGFERRPARPRRAATPRVP